MGIKFKKPGKTYYFDPQNIEIKKGDKVIVETALGDEYGEVIIGNKEVNEDTLNKPLKKVLRIATEKDTKSYEEFKQKEPEALKKCQEKKNNKEKVLAFPDIRCYNVSWTLLE